MVKEACNKAVKKAKAEVKEYVEEHSDSIGEIIVGGAVGIFVLTVAINWTEKLIPSRTRTDFHIYIHNC